MSHDSHMTVGKHSTCIYLCATCIYSCWIWMSSSILRVSWCLRTEPSTSESLIHTLSLAQSATSRLSPVVHVQCNHILCTRSSCVLVADLGCLEIKSDLKSCVPDVRVSHSHSEAFGNHSIILSISAALRSIVQRGAPIILHAHYLHCSCKKLACCCFTGSYG